MIYGNPERQDQLEKLVAEFASLWEDSGNVVDIPEEQWMAIDVVPGSKPPAAKVYPLGPKDRAVIDKEFDRLHKQGKLEWTSEATEYGFPVFVVWKTVKEDGRDIQKGRPVIDIRALNAIAKGDAYPMQTQSDMISRMAGAFFITVVDAAAFFYQWRTKLADREKFTVVSHRGSEQFNVAVMGFKNSPAYVQRQIDGISRP